METAAYESHLAAKEKEYEDLCLRCGHCCGVSDDPCQHLEKLADRSYICKIYNNRLGTQKTVTGNDFTCVPIKGLIKKAALHPGCAYSRILNS
ncbi:hypothetical protein D4R86_01235 [bacterium]|nr:MAG: hypothetical protein D4R86_01235 [bacterium]